MLIVDVIPFRRSFGAHPVSYLVPQNYQQQIKLGSLVYVPWRSSEDIAIVVQTREATEDEDLKEIIRFDYADAILCPEEIQLLFHIAGKFFLPLHRVLQLFIPLPILTRLERTSYLDVIPPTWNPHTSPSCKYEHLPDESNMLLTLKDKVKQGSHVIIAPHPFVVESIAEKLETQVTIDSPMLTPAKQFHAYQAISQKKHPIVIGTRKTLFRRIGSYDSIIYLHDGIGTDLAFYQYKLDAYWICKQYLHLSKNVHILTSHPNITNLYEELLNTQKSN